MNKADEERIRAGEAKLLLENKYLNEAFDVCEKSILSQMDIVKPSQTELHTALVMHWQILKAVKAYLYRVIETGDMALMQIAAEKRKLR